ncbi:helix-turn-helix domain-containing protein [Enterococcus sp. AZ109]|uniref:helix-turn-helix domain-containing protein n=1 Tax=Enterococcus sp. AZ109 TaxID=2774634 RepID=UPI003F239067
MTINSFDLYIANRIQEKQRLTIDDLAKKTNRSSATIRRSVQSLNDYLPETSRFIVTDSAVVSQMSYQTLIAFIQSLELHDFAANAQERFEYVLTLSSLHPSINLTSLYDDIYVSQSTKKKDRSYFVEALAKHQLQLTALRGKGTTVTGNELALRILVAKILSQTIEINEQNGIIPRQANTPLQHLIFQEAQPLWRTDNQLLVEFLKKQDLRFNYTATKFLFTYTYLSLNRLANQHSLSTVPEFLVPPPSYAFFQVSVEDLVYSSILASLDNDGPPIYQANALIQNIVAELVDYVEHRIVTTFYTKESLKLEIEHYLYKCLFRNELNFDFYDNKLDDVKGEFPFLFQLVEYFYETQLSSSFQLDEYQISTLTLLFREHVLKNKIAGRNRKKIIIVTNSAKEKSDFFAQQLNYYFDAEVVDYVNLHQIYKLGAFKYDHLITFSNRISGILTENGYPNIKLNYYLHEEDRKYLVKLNFSLNSQRKLVSEDFTKEIQAIPPEQLNTFLKQKYPDFFV